MTRLLLLAPLLFLQSCQPQESSSAAAPSSAAHVLAYRKLTAFHIALSDATAGSLLWLNTPGVSDEKPAIDKLINDELPRMEKELKELPVSAARKTTLDSILAQTDQLLSIYRNMMKELNSVAAYNDPAVLLPLQSSMYEDAPALRKKIVNALSQLENEISTAAFGGSN